MIAVAAMLPAPLEQPAPGLYELVAELLEYPEPGLGATAEQLRRVASLKSAEAASAIEAFGQYLATTDTREVEELYAKAFDLNPPTSLDLGYQLFGESYKRGTFLVKVQGAVHAHGVLHEGKLADHLTVVLRLLGHLEQKAAYDLVDEVILPVLVKVLSAFKDRTNPYRLPLEALKALLMGDYGVTEIRPIPEERPMVVPGQPGGRLGVPLAANRNDDVPGSTP